MKVAIYARFSTDKQSDSSIDDQARNCQYYADNKGWEVVTCFEDRAITGATRDRAGYQAMLAAAERGEFDVLMVDDLSRLSRKRAETTQIIERFKFRRIRIIGVCDGYDSETKGEKIQSTMRGLMNELYLDDLRDKTHRGMKGKALNGYSTGGRVYGYKRIPIENPAKLDANGRPEIVAVEMAVHEEEAKWVRQIFEWFAAGHNCKWIAAELNRQRVPSPRQKTWTTSTIYGDTTQGNGLLNNTLYVGLYVWNRSTWTKNPDTGKRCRIARPEADWVVKEMPDLRILSQEIWDAVQARQKSIRAGSVALREALNNPKSRNHTGKYLFSGMLKCGCCGANFIISGKYSYGCANNINRGEAVCANRMRVPRRIVETRLLEAIKKELFNEEAVALFVRETTRLLKQKQGEHQPDTSAMRRDLDRAEREVANIMNAIKAGILTPATKAELERAEADRSRLETALKNGGVGEDSKVFAFLPRAAERYQTLVQKLGSTLYRDVAQSRLHLKTLVGDVVLKPMEGYLEAQLQHSPEGLAAMAGDAGLKFSWLRGPDLN